MADAPEDIKVRRSERTIAIRWAPDDTRVYKACDLRCGCPCAGCVDEHTGKRTLDPATVPDDVTVESAELVGRYGLRICWSDGHATGIYTWRFLSAFPSYERV